LQRLFQPSPDLGQARREDYLPPSVSHVAGEVASVPTEPSIPSDLRQNAGGFPARGFPIKELGALFVGTLCLSIIDVEEEARHLLFQTCGR